MKRACLRIRRLRGVRAEEIVIPVQTQPGEVAQVDFGYVGKLLDPRTMTIPNPRFCLSTTCPPTREW